MQTPTEDPILGDYTREEYEAREKIRHEKKLMEITNRLEKDAHKDPILGLSNLIKERFAKFF